MDLNNFILSRLLSKDIPNTPIYHNLLNTLLRNIHTKSILGYIYEAGIKQLTIENMDITPHNLMGIFTSEFCLKYALEYLSYLNNNHEVIESFDIPFKH